MQRLGHPHFDDLAQREDGSLLVRSRATGCHHVLVVETIGEGDAAAQVSSAWAVSPTGEPVATSPHARVPSGDLFALADQVHSQR